MVLYYFGGQKLHIRIYTSYMKSTSGQIMISISKIVARFKIQMGTLSFISKQKERIHHIHIFKICLVCIELQNFRSRVTSPSIPNPFRSYPTLSRTSIRSFFYKEVPNIIWIFAFNFIFIKKYRRKWCVYVQLV
jgi:hypothetical protein